MSTETPESSAEVAETKLDLNVNIEKLSACKRHVKVSVSRGDIDRYFRDRFDKLIPEASVPGFRAGKAPRALVENRFRKQVAEQVKGALLMDSLAQVNQGDHFSAISEPDLDYEKVEIPESGDFTFEFDIEVRPDFVTPAWKGIRLQKPEKEITDSDIDQYIEVLGASSTVLVPVDEPAKAGDTVVCEVTSRLAGNTLNHVDELPLRLRPTLSLSDSVIDGFDRLMAGASAGDTRKAEVKVSEYADNSAYQGQTLEVEFRVLDVKRQEKPDRVATAGRFGFSNAGDFVDFVRNQLTSQLEYEQRQSVRDQINKKLTEAADWDLPEELLKKQFRRELQRALMELKRSGFSPEEIRGHENRLRQDAMRRTETLLKEHFILERIAEEENVTETPEDYDREIARMAASSNEPERKVRARLDRSGQIDVLRNMIIEGKVIALITEQAKFDSVPAEVGRRDRNQVEAVDFAASGELSGNIPDARYDEQPQKPIPGSVLPGAARD